MYMKIICRKYVLYTLFYAVHKLLYICGMMAEADMSFFVVFLDYHVNS
jgi:hypothetical protein